MNDSGQQCVAVAGFWLHVHWRRKLGDLWVRLLYLRRVQMGSFVYFIWEQTRFTVLAPSHVCS